LVPEIPLYLLLPDIEGGGDKADSDLNLDISEPGPDHIAQVQTFLAASQALKEFKNNLRTLVFTQVSQYIRTTLLAAGVPETGKTTILCHVTWEMIEYYQSELSKKSDLGNVLTITGSPVKALAAASSHYMSQTWGQASSYLLEQLKLGLETNSCRKEASSNSLKITTNFSGQISNSQILTSCIFHSTRGIQRGTNLKGP
jgi:hypothetical protein